MTDLHISRAHTLGLAKARKIAFKWAEHVEQEYALRCTYEEGDVQDEVCFARSGFNGNLLVSKDKFELNAKLGFLVGAFKGRIESEIVQNLDQLLAPRNKRVR